MNASSKARRLHILQSVAEGQTIRGTMRETGASKNTVLRLVTYAVWAAALRRWPLQPIGDCRSVFARVWNGWAAEGPKRTGRNTLILRSLHDRGYRLASLVDDMEEMDRRNASLPTVADTA